MNFIQSPPTHYPNSHDSTLEVFRTRNFSLNEPYPPAYGAERAPPRYQEATEAEEGEHDTAEARDKARKTRYIRILASLLIVTTVALIVGGVVGKIATSRELEREEKKAAESSAAGERVMGKTTTAEKIIVVPTQTTTAFAPSTRGSLPSDTNVKRILERGMQVTGSPVDTGRAQRPVCGASAHESKTAREEAQPTDVSEYTGLDCLLTSPSFKGGKDKEEALCSASCGQDGMEDKLAEDPIVDEWDWDAG